MTHRYSHESETLAQLQTSVSQLSTMVVRVSNALNETRNDIQALRESFSTKGSSVSAELHETVAKELHETIAEIRTEMQEALASNEILKNLGADVRYLVQCERHHSR